MEISVIIPARKERYLDKTIFEIKNKFKSDYEIIVILDGEDADRIDGVKYIYNPEAKGMRTAINQGVAMAQGKYLLKVDAHCMVDEGMDMKLLAEHQNKWVQIPRRYRLSASSWEKYGEPIDYMYLNSDLMGVRCRSSNDDKLIDNTETFQGSCYFIDKQFFKSIGLLDDISFAGSGREAQEIGFKVLANGGRIITNKKTWYAHARLGRKYVRINQDKSNQAIWKLKNSLVLPETI